jgi:hypothetical protein
MTLQKNQCVNLSALQTGMRFYFFNDKSKKVWQVYEHKKVRTRIGWEKMTVCKNHINSVQRFKSSRSIIFLRAADV